MVASMVSLLDLYEKCGVQTEWQPKGTR